MIHNVFFWLKQELPADQRTVFENELIKLKEIPYLIHGFVGRPAPTARRPVTDHSFDFSLTLHFKSLEDHEHYQTSCEHHQRFLKTCEGLWERVQVYDTSPIH